jgi:hypothetical protein
MFALSMSGCGSLWNKSGGSPGPQAQFSLTGDEQQHFEAWKQAMVKDCSTEHAFGNKSPDGGRRYIDLGLFLGHTGQSMALQTGMGTVLFGYPRSPVSSSVSRLERSTSVNGASDSFGARMTRDGARCVVEINGEVVFETWLFEDIPVLAHTFAGETTIAPLRYRVLQTEQGLLGHGLIAAWEDARVQGETLQKILKAKFTEWSDGDLAQFFPADTGIDAAGTHAVKLSASDAMPVISGRYPQIPSAVQGWQDFGDALGEVTYELILPAQKLAFGSAENTADPGLWRLAVTVSWQSVAAEVSEYRLKKVTWLDPVAADNAAAAACALQRQQLFSGTGIDGSGAFAPSFAGVSGPCRALADDFAAALYGSAPGRSMVAEKFKGVSGGGERARFHGWDLALEDLALAALAAGDDLKKNLDPAGASPLIGQLAFYTHLIAGEAVKHPATKDDSRLYVGTLAFGWAFGGLVVTAEDAAQMLQAIAHLSDPFLLAVTSWLNDLAKDPGSQQDQVTWALAVPEETKQEVRSLREKADEFGLRGVFDTVKLGRVIQDKVDIADGISRWRATLTALSGFRNRDKTRVNDIAGLSFDGKFTELAQVAVSEDWTEAEFTHADQIAVFARKRVFCESFVDTTSLIDCAGVEHFTRAAGGFFAPDFGDRYAVLASEFVALHGKLSDADHVFIRQELEREFWQPVWKGCANPEFNANRGRLATLVDQLLKADAMDRFDIEREIRSLLDQCA